MVGVSKWPRRTRLERAGRDALQRQRVYNIIHRLHELNVASLEVEAEAESIDRDELRDILYELKEKGLIYSPKPGKFVCVDE